MKALYSAASGMRALNLKVNTISNNLSNVNTTGFKKQRMEFKDLLYEKANIDNLVDGTGDPVTVEIGHGVQSVSTTRLFSRGSFQQTDNPLDFAINGDEFFTVVDGRGRTRYTKDGSFKLSVNDGTMSLVTSGGNYIQSTEGRVEMPENFQNLVIGKSGQITYEDGETGELVELGNLLMTTFSNPSGLEAIGENLFTATKISGDPQDVSEELKGEIKQGFLEGSNVEVVDEMVNLITAQRAYEVNSRSIKTADEMMSTANQIKR